MNQESIKKKWLKTLQFLAAYMVAAWTFLQFVDWILNRYQISPYWVDLLLWIFVGIIPSLLVYFHNKERINQRKLRKREKILFPLNIILIMVITYFGFGNSDLGATTKKISYLDEYGIAQSKTITKEEFRIGIPIYGFENKSGNDSISWWRYGIGRLLVYDLEQNKSLSPYSYFYTETSTKITDASIFEDFYVDGDYLVENGQVTINVYIRKANNAKILSKKTFTGDDFLNLLDEISYFITEEAGFVESNAPKYLDYPIKEFMSASEPALRAFVNGNYDEAVAIDSTFGMAYLEDAKRSLRFNVGILEVQDMIDKAYTYRNELPLQKQLEVNIQRNLAYENFEEAEAQIQLQLEVDPTEEFYNQVLFSLYGKNKDLDKYFERSEYLFNKNPNPNNGTNLANAAIASGKEQLLIDEIKKYELISPDLKHFKIQPYIFQGKIEEAESLIKELKTVHPEFKNRLTVYDSAIPYLKSHEMDTDLLKAFVGHYRSDRNEQVVNYWIENDRLIQYVNNQNVIPFNLFNEENIAGGFVNDRTWKIKMVRDSLGKAIGCIVHQYDRSNTTGLWYWKEDASIQAAHQALAEGKDSLAKQLYSKALENNPKHSYLSNIIEYLNYVGMTDPQTLLDQYQQHAGTYGPRQFYVSDGKLYYKRKSEDIDLPRVRLLPLNDHRYMDLTRFNTIMEFTMDSTEVMASGGYHYDAIDGSFEWQELDKQINYFLKSD